MSGKDTGDWFDEQLAGAATAGDWFDEQVKEKSKADPLSADPLPSYGEGVNTSTAATSTPEVERPSFLRGLTEAIFATSPGAVLNAGASNPRAIAPAAGFVNGATMGATQNVPGMRDFMEEQRAKDPAGYAVGDTVGAFANPINELGAGLKKGWGMARGAAQGFVQQGVKDWSESDPEQPTTDRVIHALKAGAEGAAGALTVDALARGVGVTAEGAAKLSEDAYNRARIGAAQVPAKVIENFAEKRNLPSGRPAIAALVSENEKLVPHGWFELRNPDDYVAMYKEPLQDANAAITHDILRAQAAGAQLPADVRGTAAQSLVHQASRAAHSGGVNNEMANPLMTAARQAKTGPQFRDPFALRNQRIQLDGAVYDTPNKGSPEDLASKAKLQLSNEFRKMGYDYVAQGGPDIARDFDKHNRNYEALAAMSGAAKPASFNAAAGGARAAGDSAAGNFMRTLGRIPGLDYAPDLVGNIARPTTAAFQGIGDAAGWLSKNSGAMTSNGVDIAQSLMGGKVSAQDATNTTFQPNSNSRGDLAPQNYNRIFMGHQEAFAPWADKFAAIDDIDTNDDRFTAKFEYLYRTDQEFARRVDALMGEGYPNAR